MCIKCLTNSGLHTWHGMLGYCTKYEPIAKERDGELMSSRKGVTDDDIALGKQLYLEWGRPNKRTIELTPKNLMGRMEVYVLQSLRRVPRPNMWRVLATMLASRKYSLGGEWGKKWAALNSEALSIVWRQRTAMETLTIDQLMTVIVGQYVPRRIHSQDQGDPSPEGRFARIFERDDLYEEDEVVEAREQAMGAGGGPSQPSGLGSGYRSASGAEGAGDPRAEGAGGHRSASDGGVANTPSWSGTIGSGSTTASSGSSEKIEDDDEDDADSADRGGRPWQQIQCALHAHRMRGGGSARPRPDAFAPDEEEDYVATRSDEGGSESDESDDS